MNRQASAEEIKGGCPPGKIILWITKLEERNGILEVFKPYKEIILSGYLLYDTLDEALADMARQLKFFGGNWATVNYKSEDGKKIDIWKMEKKVLEKQR